MKRDACGVAARRPRRAVAAARRGLCEKQGRGVVESGVQQPGYRAGRAPGGRAATLRRRAAAVDGMASGRAGGCLFGSFVCYGGVAARVTLQRRAGWLQHKTRVKAVQVLSVQSVQS